MAPTDRSMSVRQLSSCIFKPGIDLQSVVELMIGVPVRIQRRLTRAHSLAVLSGSNESNTDSALRSAHAIDIFAFAFLMT